MLDVRLHVIPLTNEEDRRRIGRRVGDRVAVQRDKLDIFIVSTDGGVYTAAWDHNVANGHWRGWWRIGDLVAKPGAAVAAVAREHAPPPPRSRSSRPGGIK